MVTLFEVFVFALSIFIVGGALVVEAVADGKFSAQTLLKKYNAVERAPFTEKMVSPKITKPHIAYPKEYSNLNINFLGVDFQNPFCLSSSPVSNDRYMVARAYEAGFGGAVFKTIGVDLTNQYKIFHPSPRLGAVHIPTKRAAIGIQNVEQISDRLLHHNLEDIRWLRDNFPDRPIISSIMGYEDEDWGMLARESEKAGAHMIEMNFSCPQVFSNHIWFILSFR